jgi:NAD(P)-dependent dehydrogenase (short-subunit alcohol dehydrogenase family)
VRQEIAGAIDNDRLETYAADFASLAAVRSVAEQITARHDRLDVLINDAGLGAGPRGRQRRELSADGHELRFQVNMPTTWSGFDRLSAVTGISG